MQGERPDLHEEEGSSLGEGEHGDEIHLWKFNSGQLKAVEEDWQLDYGLKSKTPSFKHISFCGARDPAQVANAVQLGLLFSFQICHLNLQWNDSVQPFVDLPHCYGNQRAGMLLFATNVFYHCLQKGYVQN